MGDLLIRRRELILPSSAPPKIIGFVPGTYTANGGTVVVDSSGVWALYDTPAWKAYTVPFNSLIEVHTGDVVKFVLDNAYSSNPGNSFFDVGFKETDSGSTFQLKVAFNKRLYKTNAEGTTNIYQATASSDFSSSYWSMYARAALSLDAYQIKFKIWINDVQIA